MSNYHKIYKLNASNSLVKQKKPSSLLSPITYTTAQDNTTSELPMPSYTPLLADWDASQHPLLKKQIAAPNQKSSPKTMEADNQTIQAKSAEQPNRTGMPNRLKTGIENLSGMSMDDVKVYYNSHKPAQLQALAYTQGTNIHIAPGQEKHLSHEAWHVVQQKQGRVKPTMQIKGTPINDDSALEQEADVMGDRTMIAQPKFKKIQTVQMNSSMPIQPVKKDLSGLHVQVNDEDNSWYGQVIKNLDDSYQIRVGGTDRIVEVAEKKVTINPSFWDLLKNKIETNVKDLGPFDIQTEVNDFSSQGGINAQIVESGAMIEEELKKTSAHTIAMFNYLDKYADTLNVRMTQDMNSITHQYLKTLYLQVFSNVMYKRLMRGLWAGEYEQYIIFGLEDIASVLKAGKNIMLHKWKEAQTANTNLVELLKYIYYNQDAKVYERRVMTWKELELGNVPKLSEFAKLQSGEPISYDELEFVDFEGEFVESVDLEKGTKYTVFIKREGKSKDATVIENNKETRQVTLQFDE